MSERYATVKPANASTTSRSTESARITKPARVSITREPQAPTIWAFTIGSVIILIVVILALQQYFDKIWNDAVYEKVLAPPSQELQDLRNRDDWALTHYSYQDKSKGQVRIPLDQAQELFLKEAAEGKTVLSGQAHVAQE